MPSTKNNTPTRKCLYALLLCAFTLLAIFYMQFSLFVVDFSLATTLFWHVQSVEIVNTPRIALIYVFDSPERLSDFTIAMSTMKCYALRHNHYSLFVLYTPQPSAEEVKAENQTDEPEHCHNCTQSDFFFRRHCFVANWMKAHPEFHWVLFMDADVGVINPNRMVEEYIQPGVELHFFDRLYNNEITAGSYLARNSKYARDFLHYWGDYFYRLPKSFHGTDNGAIHAVFMEKFANLPSNNTCQQIYDKSKNYDDLNQFTVCARHYFESQFGPNRTLDQGRLMLYPKGRGWMRDGGHTGTRFYRRDFMFHGWKQSTLDKPQKNPWTIPFNSTEKFEDPEFCSNGTAWPYKAQFFEEDEQKIEDELKRKIQLVYEERQKTLKQLGISGNF